MLQRQSGAVRCLVIVGKITGKKPTGNSKETMDGALIPLFPAKLMLLAARPAAKLPKPRFGIHRGVLPVAVPTKDNHARPLGKFPPQLLSLVGKCLVGVIVLFVVPVWADDGRWAKHQFEGRVRLVERFEQTGLDPMRTPAALVVAHGPFAWGSDPMSALEHGIMLEETACLAFQTIALNPDISPVPPALLDKHFLRKHGSDAYYGQRR